MAEFAELDAHLKEYFADPTTTGTSGDLIGNAQQFDRQPSSQGASALGAVPFEQSLPGDDAFYGLVSNSTGVSGTGYIPGADDMPNLALFGSGSGLPSLQGLPHDANISQYAHMQDMHTGRNRSLSTSSRESTMSAMGNGSATLFPAVPPNQYFNASPNIPSVVAPESGTSYLLQGLYASHGDISQQQQISAPIPGVQTQPKRMSTALRQRLAAVQQPKQSVPSLASTTRGQFAAPSMLLPPEPLQRKRHAHEPESDDQGLNSLGQRSRSSARSGQPAKRQRRGSVPGVEEAQPVDQITMSTPFATPPFAPAFPHGFAVNSGPYYASGFPLAPIPEQDGLSPSAASEQQLLAEQPKPFYPASTRTGSRRELTPKMRQDLARMKAVRDRRLAARAAAAEPFAPSIPSPAIGQFTPVEGDQLAAAQYSGPYVATDNSYSADDWLGRLLSDANRNMANAEIAGSSRDMLDQTTNPSAIFSEPVASSSGGWEAAAVTPGPDGQVYFEPRFAGDYDYDGNFNFGIGVAPMSSVALPATPIEADGWSGGNAATQNAYPNGFHGFDSCNFQHGTGCSSDCPSHATGTPHSHAFPAYKDFGPSLDEDDDNGNEDVGPVAESSKDAAKRASASRGRGKSEGQPVKRGRKLAPAGRSASGKTPKSSGSRVQGLNTYTPANPPRLPVHLPEIVQGHTPCPFCQHPIRTELKNSVLPSMCQVKEHLFGYNDNPPCPALVYWVVSWPKGGDPVGIAIIGEIIVRQWPDEVKGTDEEEWFPYRMWGKKTGFGGELLKWWKGLSQERKDEILGKGKGEEAKDE